MIGTDVLVLGAGPAGWAAAAACASEGLRVHVVAPDPFVTWSQTYGAWLDELAGVGLHGVASRQWDTVLVRTVGSALRPLGRTYALIDNDRLRTVLSDRAVGVSTAADHARQLDRHADHLVVTTAAGARISARAVIDATGHPAVFGAGRPRSALAYQTAYGIVARFERPPLPAGTMCLMDFDARAFSGTATPTFLYAMDLGEGQWLVEETALAARPALPITELRRRLEQRLAAQGSVPGRILRRERVAFAMDVPVPDPSPAIAFGAAAGMVHPATGYHVAEALRRAPRVAAAVRAALDEHTDVRAIALAGRRAVWTDSDLRRDALYRIGLDALLALDTAATQAFFDGFFSLRADEWRGYVSRTATPLVLQRTMLRLMTRVPGTVRRRVLRAVVADRAWRRLTRVIAPRGLSG